MAVKPEQVLPVPFHSELWAVGRGLLLPICLGSKRSFGRCAVLLFALEKLIFYVEVITTRMTLKAVGASYHPTA